MGLFRQKDELFEIMSRQQGSVPGKSSSGSKAHRPPSISTTKLARGKPARSPFSPISWAYGRGDGVGDLIEIDGEPLVIVEDGLTEALATAEEAPTRTYSVRADTVVVGGLLSLGLVFTAFFLGRNTGDPAEAATQDPALAVAMATAEPGTAASIEPEETEAKPASSRAGTSVSAGFRPDGGTATAKPASVKRDAKKGKYTLVVCTTTAKAGKEVAKWLNTDSRSPIFGRNGLEAYATRRGSVRIKGFAARDKAVLSRVRATYDPLGGSSKFTSAYFLKSR